MKQPLRRIKIFRFQTRGEVNPEIYKEEEVIPEGTDAQFWWPRPSEFEEDILASPVEDGWGYFHRWLHHPKSPEFKVYALIERHDGTIIQRPAHLIQFTKPPS